MRPCRRVVHRDLKLENLLLAVPGDISRVKIADFGLAKKVAGTGPAGMQTICGTPQVRVAVWGVGNRQSDSCFGFGLPRGWRAPGLPACRPSAARHMCLGAGHGRLGRGVWGIIWATCDR